MEKAMHYYQFNIGDYASHTRHLTNLEDLAYRRLLDAYYLQEHPLNSGITTVARQINMREYETEVKAVLEEFFTLTDDGWFHQRIDNEIKHFQAKRQQASNAGKASAERRNSIRSTDVQPTNNQEPITNNQQPIIKKSSASSLKPDDVSESVWSDFLALRKANKSPLTETALKGIKREAVNAGMTLEKVLQLCCARGWRGFKAEWVTEEVKKDDLYKQNIEAIFGKRREIDITPQQDFLEG